MTKTFSHGAIPSVSDARDFKFEALALLPGTRANETAKIPKTLDLRDKLLAVRDQGADGACVAFALSTVKDYQEKMDVGLNEFTAPQYVYNLRADRSSEGMQPRNALNILRGNGIVLEKEFPYSPGNTKNVSSKLKKEGLKFKVDGYAAVKTIDGLKLALVTHGPAILVFPVYNFGEHFWFQHGGESLRGYHCVAVVGYTKTGFIIRNSWGDAWNEAGHTELPYSDWGLQTECWSFIDANTAKIVKENLPGPVLEIIGLYTRAFNLLKTFFENLFKFFKK